MFGWTSFHEAKSLKRGKEHQKSKGSTERAKETDKFPEIRYNFFNNNNFRWSYCVILPKYPHKKIN